MSFVPDNAGRAGAAVLVKNESEHDPDLYAPQKLPGVFHGFDRVENVFTSEDAFQIFRRVTDDLARVDVLTF